MEGNAFDTHFDNWEENQNAPWSRLQRVIASENIDKHLTGDRLQILDAGGGDGLFSIPFAQNGHHVTIIDSSRVMLDRAGQRAEEMAAGDRVKLHHADVGQIGALFRGSQFDLIICHNVIQYLDSPEAVLKTFPDLLAPGGVVSLMAINRFSEAYRLALQTRDFANAIPMLDARSRPAILFGIDMTIYSIGEGEDMLKAAGLETAGRYGVRCFNDYIPDNSIKYEQKTYAEIEALERAMTGRFPYYQIARYWQIVATNQTPNRG